MSTNPGVTSSPVASTVSTASPSSDDCDTSTTTPSFTATSPTKRGAPVPSTMVPLVTLTLYMTSPPDGSAVDELDLGVVDAVHEGVGKEVDAAGHDVDLAHPAHELLEEHLDLEACERGAEAEVGSEPEGDVVVRRAGDVVALGIVEVLRVAVRRRVHQDHLLALADRLATDLVVAVGHPAHVEHRCDPADELLDRHGHVGTVAEQLVLLGSRRELEDGAGDDRAGGLRAAVEQQQAVADDRIETDGLAVDRCRRPDRHDVV